MFKSSRIKMEHEETQKTTRSSCLLVQLFQIISISFLSLLIPLSFLFLSRLSVSSSSLVTVSGLFSVLHQVDITVLYTILSLIVVSTLIHNLSGKPEYSVLHSHLYICWIILFIVQACVAFGIEGTMITTTSTNTESLSLAPEERLVLVRVMFFLGLHEVMLIWFRVVVKPVLDDTVLGVFVEEERLSDRAIVAVTFGIMWWWRLRDEVERLVVVAEIKRKLLIDLEGIDFVKWWMYYMCVAIGLVKIFKGFLFIVNMLILNIKKSRKGSELYVTVDLCNDDHV